MLGFSRLQSFTRSTEKKDVCLAQTTELPDTVMTIVCCRLAVGKPAKDVQN